MPANPSVSQGSPSEFECHTRCRFPSVNLATKECLKCPVQVVFRHQLALVSIVSGWLPRFAMSQVVACCLLVLAGLTWEQAVVEVRVHPPVDLEVFDDRGGLVANVQAFSRKDCQGIIRFARIGSLSVKAIFILWATFNSQIVSPRPHSREDLARRFASVNPSDRVDASETFFRGGWGEAGWDKN